MNIRCPHCAKIVTVPDGATATEGLCANCGKAVDVTKAERVGLSVGEVLGGCRVDGLLGVGGMAVVHRATQLSMERPVALKVLAPHLAPQPRFVERFHREATALAQLSHPNIVHIYAKGSEGGVYYFVMEYVEGESLRTRLCRQGKLPLAEAVALLDQVAAGLEYAHAQGILHRDIKPENVLVAKDGMVKLGDFGIARIVADDATEPGRQTVGRVRVGSANYMAPEQARDEPTADHRVDIYGLGVVLYEMLTGQVPVGQFAPASRLAEGVPAAVDRVLARALAASPAERFPDVAQFRSALAAAVRPAAPARPRPRVTGRRVRPRSTSAPAVVVVVLLVLGLLTWYLVWRGRGQTQEPVAPPPATPKASAPAVAPEPVAQRPAVVEPGAKTSPEPKTPAEEPSTEAAVPAEPPPEEVAGLDALRGTIRALADGRVELLYDWSDAAQLADWRPSAGTDSTIAGGELLIGGAGNNALRHAAKFRGDMDVAGAWRILEEMGQRSHCGIALCAAPWRAYWLFLGSRRQSLYKMDSTPQILSRLSVKCPDGTPHTFHFARWGSSVRAWIDGNWQLETAEPTYREGSVSLGSWRARSGLRNVWILAQPDPEWLARNPGVAAQLTALRLYASGVDALAPAWAKRDYIAALTRAKALAAEEPYAASPDAAKWIAADAEALAGLWQTVLAGAAKLKAGEAVRVAGVAGAFQRLEGGALYMQEGPVTFAKKLAELKDDELIQLAQRARELKTGTDHLALALLRLHAAAPDLAKARAELALAQEAGIDVSRHRGLLIQRPDTAERLTPAKGEWPSFTGEALFLEAEAAARCLRPMEVQRDPAASGGAFVSQPIAPGEDQYGDKAGRVVFHVAANRPRTAFLWARVRTPSSSANSFLLAAAPGQVADAKLAVWHLAVGGQWNWQPYNAQGGVDQGSAQPSPIQLQAGVNSIIIAIRERGAALDRICLSGTPDPPTDTPRR